MMYSYWPTLVLTIDELFFMANENDENIIVELCMTREHACAGWQGTKERFIFLYETIFSNLGIRLPLTEFEKVVLRKLNVALTQLHPNRWAFVKSFEIL